MHTGDWECQDCLLVRYLAPFVWGLERWGKQSEESGRHIGPSTVYSSLEVALFEAHGIRTTSFRHPVLEDGFTSVAVFTSSYLNPLSSVVNTQT
jgi:hypothetical protein